MENNLQHNQEQEEFIAYIQMLQGQSNLSFTNDQYRTLKKYTNFLIDCLMWKYRNLYLKLFRSFSNFSISGDEFTEQFLGLRRKHTIELNRFIDELKISLKPVKELHIDSKAFGFYDILIETYESCDAFVSDQLLESIGGSRDVGEIDENELRVRIKEAFLIIHLFLIRSKTYLSSLN